MSSDDAEKLREAFEIYRFVWSEVLPRFAGAQSDEVTSLLEEVKEALLDLKQATIDLDLLRVAKHNDEVLTLLIELRERLQEE